MYELGLAHAMAKPVVQIGQSEEDVPFDLRQYRFHIYDLSSRRWAAQLQGALCLMLNASLSDPSSSVAFGAEAISAAHPSTLDRILRTQTVRAGCIRQPPLLDYSVDSLFGTRAIGLYAQLMDHVAVANGLTVAYVHLRFSEMATAVREGKVDLVLCTFPTPPRVLQVDFAAFLHSIGVAAIVRGDRVDVQIREDLSRPDVRIAVLKGEVGWEYATSGLKLTNASDRLSVVEHEQISKALDLVKTGEATVALADALSCLQYVSENKADCSHLETRFIENPLYTYKVGVMHAKGDSKMKDWISENFELARTVPEIKAIEAAILKQYNSVIGRVSDRG